MPNNFLVVGLCARDWSRCEDPNEVSFVPLVGANLCELIAPLPTDLEGITSPGNERYIHKTTGEICRNGPPFADTASWHRVAVDREELARLRLKYGATNWFDWQSQNWGTKWGTYGTKAHSLGGDGAPILIEFQTAWGPPSPVMMRRITDYLCETYHLKNIRWVGHDPCDDSTLEIPVDDGALIAARE